MRLGGGGFDRLIFIMLMCKYVIQIFSILFFLSILITCGIFQAKALAEKNMRDLLAQKELAEKNV